MSVMLPRTSTRLLGLRLEHVPAASIDAERVITVSGVFINMPTMIQSQDSAKPKVSPAARSSSAR